MAYFPFFVDLTGRTGLLVGGGAVALRKAEKLLPYGPALTVVAPEVLPALTDLPGVTVIRRPFSPADLEGADFVIAAADDGAVNAQVSALCRGQKRPVNVVDDPARCSFLFPALVRRGSLSVGISTGGSSPTAAIWLKEQIAALLPEGMEEILDWLEAQRPVLKAAIPEENQRARAFSRLFAACLAAGGPPEGDAVADILREVEA